MVENIMQAELVAARYVTPVRSHRHQICFLNVLSLIHEYEFHAVRHQQHRLPTCDAGMFP